MKSILMISRRYMDRYSIVLTCIVFYMVMSIVGEMMFARSNAMATVKSLVGIVGTTTVMHHISDIGRSLVPGEPDETSVGSLILRGRGESGSSAAAVVLGTCFVMVSGCLPVVSRYRPYRLYRFLCPP